MLEVQAIDVFYGSVQVIWGGSITINEGETISIIGNNGSGKSSLSRTIMGVIKPRNGSITFLDVDITNRPTHERIGRGITMVPEGRELFPGMSIKENLLLGAHSIRDNGRIKRNLNYVFSVFPRLEKREAQLAGTLSGGEQQMLAIARALMMNPRLLILDEPSLGLAPVMVDRVFETIQSLKKEGLTILICAQNIKKALMISDRGYVMESGRIVLEDMGPKLLENPKVKEAYLGI